MLGLNYDQWIERAEDHKKELDSAIAKGNDTGIVYHRGKYIFALKQAYKLNPHGKVPAHIIKKSLPEPLTSVIKTELKNHKDQIDLSLKDTKKDASIKITKPSALKETFLKISRLSSRAKHIYFSPAGPLKDAQKKEMVKDSTGLAATSLLKLPAMTALKTGHYLGPVVVFVAALPINLVVSAIIVTAKIGSGKTVDIGETYTKVDSLSKALRNGIKDITKVFYEQIGRL